MSPYAPLGQGTQPPIASPSAVEKSPQAVGFGMKFAPTPAKKKSSAAIAKKILPMTFPLKEFCFKSRIHLRRMPAMVTS